MTKIALSSGPMVVTIVVFAVVFADLRVVVTFLGIFNADYGTGS